MLSIWFFSLYNTTPELLFKSNFLEKKQNKKLKDCLNLSYSYMISIYLKVTITMAQTGEFLCEVLAIQPHWHIKMKGRQVPLSLFFSEKMGTKESKRLVQVQIANLSEQDVTIDFGDSPGN